MYFIAFYSDFFENWVGSGKAEVRSLKWFADGLKVEVGRETLV